MKGLRVKNFILIILAFITICSLCIGIATFNRLTAEAEDAKIVSEIKDVYLLGESFTVGEVQISYNEKTYSSTDGALICPNGVAYSRGTYSLDDTGEYVLKYSFKTEDGSYGVAQKNFQVQQLVYSVTSELSSFSYVEECPHYDKIDNYTAPWETLNKDENGATDFANSILPAALTVKLAEGETFYYNTPVKLNKENVTSLVNYYTPQYIDNYVAERIIVRITDCFDKNNYIDIVNEYSRAIDFRTAMPGTISRYMSKGDKLNVEYDKTNIDGVDYVSRREEDWGITLVASSPNPTVFVRDAKVGFNYENSWTYAMSPYDEWLAIIDTTNKDFFSDKAFKGFTSDQVFISIRGENYAKSELLEFSIMELAGVRGEDLKITNYYDNESPIISVDYQPTDHNGVYIVKGKEFKVFDATATDVNLIDDINVEVFYSSSSKPITVNCIDGKFTPDKTGEYNIVYSVKDKYGNATHQTVRLMCVETDNGQGAKLYVDRLTQAKVGEDLIIPTPIVESINGKAEATASIVDSEGKSYSVDFSKPVILEKAGEYKLIYTYGDRYYKYAYEYSFTAVQAGIVRFIDSPVVPAYLMAGKKYSTNALNVYDFTGSELVICEATVSVKYDDGQYQVIDVNNFTVDVKASKAKFMYSYSGVESCYSEEIPVVNVGSTSNIDMTKYFVGNFNAEAQTDGITFSVQEHYGTVTLDYINRVVLDGFELQFKLPEKYDNYQSFNVVFTDYYNRQNSIRLKFSKVNGGMTFSVNDGEGEFVRSKFASDTESISLYYNPLNETFNLRGICEYAFKSTFVSGYCNIGFELEGVAGQSKIVLQQLLNQMLTNVSRDNVGPVVSYVSKINSAKIGEEFVIKRAYTADVLSGVLDKDFTLIVTDPDGNVVKSVDDILLDGTCSTDREYVILLDKVGNYSILFNAKDSSGRVTTSPGWLSLAVVGDSDGPDIKIKSNEQLKAVSVSLGKAHVVEIDVSDNYSLNQDLVVTVNIFSNAQGNFVYYNLVNFLGEEWEKSEFTANQKGEYTVYVYAYDQVGNITVKSYTLIVD